VNKLGKCQGCADVVPFNEDDHHSLEHFPLDFSDVKDQRQALRWTGRLRVCTRGPPLFSLLNTHGERPDAASTSSAT